MEAVEACVPAECGTMPMSLPVTFLPQDLASFVVLCCGSVFERVCVMLLGYCVLVNADLPLLRVGLQTALHAVWLALQSRQPV